MNVPANGFHDYSFDFIFEIMSNVGVYINLGRLERRISDLQDAMHRRYYYSALLLWSLLYVNCFSWSYLLRGPPEQLLGTSWRRGSSTGDYCAVSSETCMIGGFPRLWGNL